MSNNDPLPNPAPEPGAVRAFYDSFSDQRTQKYLEHGNPRLEKAIARILSWVKEESTVLEIGCGAGLVAEGIARATTAGHIWACDVSPAAIALAQQRVKASNIEFRALDVAAGFDELKAWLPGPVDLVALVDTLEHLPLGVHAKLFENLAAVLHDNSAVILTYPSPGYQRYLRMHSPSELQIIDEIIELPHLHEVTTQNGFAIKHFSLEDVWLPNQYVHCVLTRSQAYSPMDQASA